MGFHENVTSSGAIRVRFGPKLSFSDNPSNFRNGSAAVLRTSPLCLVSGLDRILVDCGTVANINRQIRSHRETGATQVALRPVHANGGY